MKNVLRFILAAIALAGFAATEASAQASCAGLLTTQGKWRSNQSGNQQFVDFKVIAGGSVADTSNWFSTDGIAPLGGINIAATDSVAYARFVVYVDTLYSVPQGSFTAAIDGSFGTDNAVFSVGSITVNPTTGQKFFQVPVYMGAAPAAGIHPDDLTRLPSRLRLRVSNAGTAWAGARIALQSISAVK